MSETWELLQPTKIGVLSGDITSTESESEEAERSNFLPIPLTTPLFMIQ